MYESSLGHWRFPSVEAEDEREGGPVERAHRGLTVDTEQARGPSGRRWSTTVYRDLCSDSPRILLSSLTMGCTPPLVDGNGVVAA